MKVIFIKDLKGQGKTGEVKDVKDGYGMNFLVKKGYAIPATNVSITNLKRNNEEKKLEESLLVHEMEIVKEKLAKEKISFTAKTGAGDRMFGQISVKQIKGQLEKLGYHIDKNAVQIDHPIMSLGFHDVQIVLHKQVIAIIKVQVIKGK